MIVGNHELTSDNIKDWSTDTLTEDKETLLNSTSNIQESLKLVKLIRIELKRREVIEQIDDLADYASKRVMEEN